MKYALLLTLLPALLAAQELQFRQEYDTIPVEIAGWQTFAPFGGGESESYPEFCDLDADGDLDLFIGNYLGFITYCHNTGTPLQYDYELTTRAWNGINLNNMINFGKSSPRFCDLDGDGDYDFFTGDGVGLIHYWQNIGTAALPEFEFVTDSLEYIDNTGKSHFCFADIDADSDYDLFMGNYYGNILFYRNEGNPFAWDINLISPQFAGIDVGYNAIPNFVDIDSDNDLDLFIGNKDGYIWYYRNDGDSVNYNFTYVTDFYDSIWVGWYAAPEFADIDADGDYDLFVGRESENAPNNAGDVFYYKNLGNASSPEWQLITQNYLCLDQGETSQNHHADIDADGDYDLFSANFNDRISFYENVGAGDSASFHWVTDSYQDVAVNGAYIFFSDIDADQDSDLFVGEVVIPNPPYPGLHLFQNSGTPQNASFSLYSSNLVPGEYHVAVIPALVDIDADQDKDLFLSDNDDIRYFFENTGSPTSPVFGNPAFGWFGAFESDFLPSYCFYDIDDDGDLDLFGVPHLYNYVNPVWFYRNIGTNQNPSFVLVTENLLPLERMDTFIGIDIFDIDHDGDGDILLSLTYDGGMYFFRNVTGETPSVPPLPRTAPYRGPVLEVGPNPANPVTTFNFELRAASFVGLEVYDVSGRRVAELLSGRQEAGAHVITWDASGLGSGVYLARLTTSGYQDAQKIVVVK